MNHIPRRPVVGGAIAMKAQKVATLRRLMGIDDPEMDADDALWLNGLEGETNGIELCHWLARKVRSFTALAADAEARITAIKGRLERFERQAEQGRAGIRYLMEEMRLDRLPPHPEATISLGRGREGVEITAENLIPDEYRTQPPPPPKRIDKQKLKDAVLSGIPVPGATKVVGDPTVIIRWK